MDSLALEYAAKTKNALLLTCSSIPFKSANAQALSSIQKLVRIWIFLWPTNVLRYWGMTTAYYHSLLHVLCSKHSKTAFHLLRCRHELLKGEARRVCEWIDLDFQSETIFADFAPIYWAQTAFFFFFIIMVLWLQHNMLVLLLSLLRHHGGAAFSSVLMFCHCHLFWHFPPKTLEHCDSFDWCSTWRPPALPPYKRCCAIILKQSLTFNKYETWINESQPTFMFAILFSVSCESHTALAQKKIMKLWVL